MTPGQIVASITILAAVAFIVGWLWTHREKAPKGSLDQPIGQQQPEKWQPLFPRVEITSHDLTGRNSYIKIGGVDISSIATGLELRMNAGEINRLVLRLNPREVEVDGEALTDIAAVIDLGGEVSS